MLKIGRPCENIFSGVQIQKKLQTPLGWVVIVHAGFGLMCLGKPSLARCEWAKRYRLTLVGVVGDVLGGTQSLMLFSFGAQMPGLC